MSLARELYDEQFYSETADGSASSAAVVVPILLEMFPSRSAVDVGCGRGHWLAELSRLGMAEILGIDFGDAWKKGSRVHLDSLLDWDLRQPIKIERRFDLVLSLEVAEHLPAEFARVFVNSLVGLGPLVVFSAAVPRQGGDGHVNEQWSSYWVEHFSGRGYDCFDVVRPVIWREKRVKWWYRQNTLVFADRTNQEIVGRLRHLEAESRKLIDIVHPDLFGESMDDLERTWFELKCLKESRERPG